jgi:hypothetical protein
MSDALRKSIAYGSGISDEDGHNHDKLPVLLAGRGGGSVSPGRDILYAGEVLLTNLWVALPERVGGPRRHHGRQHRPPDMAWR